MFFAKPAGDTFAAVAKWEVKVDAGTATPHSEQLTKRRCCLVSVQLSGRGRASAVRGGDDSDDLWAERNPH